MQTCATRARSSADIPLRRGCALTIPLDKPCRCRGNNPQCRWCGGLGVLQPDSESGKPGLPAPKFLDVQATAKLDEERASRLRAENDAAARVEKLSAAKRATRTAAMTKRTQMQPRPSYLRCGHCQSFCFYPDIRSASVLS